MTIIDAIKEFFGGGSSSPSPSHSKPASPYVTSKPPVPEKPAISPPPKKYTKRRSVPIKGGSSSYEVWDNELLIWILWIDLIADGVDFDINILPDVSSDEPHLGEEADVDDVDIPTVGLTPEPVESTPEPTPTPEPVSTPDPEPVRTSTPSYDPPTTSSYDSGGGYDSGGSSGGDSGGGGCD